jgi:hypothetical protein
MHPEMMPHGSPMPASPTVEPAGNDPNAAHRTQARPRTTHAQGQQTAPPLSAARTAPSRMASGAPQPPGLIGPAGYDPLH